VIDHSKMSGYTETKSKETTFTTKAPVAEVKTSVYAANLGERTEGNQNWNQEADMGQETIGEKASEMAQRAKESAASAAENVDEKVSQVKDSVTQTAADTSEAIRAKWEEGKETLGEALQAGKEKLTHVSEVAGEKFGTAKTRIGEAIEADKEMLAQKESTPGVVERVTHSLQQKGHEWAESAQHSLEVAREKAREVFVGAQQKADETSISGKSNEPVFLKGGELAYGGAGTTEVKVKTNEPAGNVKVETQTTAQ